MDSFFLIPLLLICCDTKPVAPKPPATGKVYFVCRSEYEAPLGHRIVEFQADSILDWLQREWPDRRLRKKMLGPAYKRGAPPGTPIELYDPDAVWDHIRERLNGSVYSMASMWRAMAEWGEVPPKNVTELEKFVATVDYYGGPIAFSEHGLQVLTDDDEIEIAWYLFDEQYIKENPVRSAFLLHQEWNLPETFGDQGIDTSQPFTELNPNGDKSQGATYCVFLSSLDGITISDITGTFRISGVRLPNLAAFLKNAEIPMKKNKWRDSGLEPTWPPELLLTRALVHHTQSENMEYLIETVSGSRKLSKLWTFAGSVSNRNYDNHLYFTGDTAKTESELQELFAMLEPDPKEKKSYWTYTLQPLMTQVSPHMCQARFLYHVESRDGEFTENDLESFIFFDDLWMAANPMLAESILNYAAKWDVLFDTK